MTIQPGVSSANAPQPQPSNSVDKKNTPGKITNDTSGSPPQTNVAIKNAIADLSKILSEITGTQNDSIDGMPPEIQKLVQDILQDSFSLDKTLSQGLGETLQARRYAFDQLASLGKILTQLGESMENDDFTGMPDTVKTLLSDFRSVLSKSEQIPNTVDLTKTSFSLLNNRNISDLPETLQTILNTDRTAAQPQKPANENLQMLKNVLDTLFKDDIGSTVSTSGTIRQNRPAAVDSAAAATSAAAESGPLPAETGSSGKKTGLPVSTPPDELPAPGPSDEPVKTAARPAAASAAPAVPNKETGTNQQTNIKNTAVPEETVPASSQPAAAKEAAVLSQPQQTGKNIPPQTAPAVKMPAADQPSVISENASSEAFSDAINNTPQSVQTLRDLGSLILQDNDLSPRDIALLKDFVNDDQVLLPEKDAVQLQKAMQVVENNIPGLIAQTAAKQNLPNLAKLWAFVQLSDISTINEDSADSLKQSGKDITDFSKIMQNSFSTDSASTVTQKSLDFVLPIFLDDQKSYPAYVNVYNEGRRNPNTGEEQHETWFRVCCLTENAGAVEVVLRLYNKQNLNIRLAFSSEDTATSFEDYLPDLRSYLHKSKLNLTELKIGAID